jgi:hypothetical protein
LKHHLLIAGTGRAGTSFLVQYLAACGLDTHLARNPEDRLDENANAGLEDFPANNADLPYVIKSPWLYEFVDELLERDNIEVDAVIIPMRDLVEAAASRVANELRARLGQEAIPGELTLWHTWGSTPGGVVYSLNPIDQARLLSMGFHRVVHACVKKRVPLIFLEFPRFIADGEYLYKQLQPILKGIDLSTAMLAHAKTARPDKVRIGGELASSTNITKGDLFPDFDALDRVALHREITNARRDRDIHRTELANLRSVIADVEQRLGEHIQDRDHWKEQAAQESAHRIRTEQELEEGRRQHESQVSDMQRAHLQQLEESIGERDRTVSDLRSAIADVEQRLEEHIQDRDRWRGQAALESAHRVRTEQELEEGRCQHKSQVSDMQRAHLQQLEETIGERDRAVSDLRSTIVDVEQRLGEHIQDRDHWKEQAAQESAHRVCTEQELEEGRRQHESQVSDMQRTHQQQLDEAIGERDRAISDLRSAIVALEQRLGEHVQDRDHWKEQATQESAHRVRKEQELDEGRRQHESQVSDMQHAHLQQLEEVVSDRDRLASEMNKKSAMMDEILTSTSWRITDPLRKLNMALRRK